MGCGSAFLTAPAPRQRGPRCWLDWGGGWVHGPSMQLALPTEIEARLSPESAALHLAIGLFVGDEATLGQASVIAGMPQTRFLMELGRRRIPIHYGAEELAADLSTIAQLTPK